MREGWYREGAKQETPAPSPAPRLIPAETEHQRRTNIEIGTANGGTSRSVLRWFPTKDNRATEESFVSRNDQRLLTHPAQVALENEAEKDFAAGRILLFET